MDDDRIVERFLLRDEAAIELAAEKYGRLLYSLAYGIVQDAQEAEECENDTYWQAWNSIPPHEPRTYLFAFLARITRHGALNRCRASGRQKRSAILCELSAEMEQCLPAADDLQCRMDELTLKEALNTFLATLTEEQRNLFLRRYWYMDSVAQLAARFSVSESKVKTTLFRCRKRLRTHLQKEGYPL